MGINCIVTDIDGVVYPFRSAWQRLHRILGVDASMNADAYRRGLITYEDWALVDTLLWRGTHRRWVEGGLVPRQGVEELCALRSRVWLVAISHGVGYTRSISRCFDMFIVNNLVFRGGVVDTIHMSHEEKDEAAEKALGLLGVGWDAVAAVGDGPNDIPMMRKASIGIAFNPTSPEVAEAARLVVWGRTLSPLARVLAQLVDPVK